MKKSHYRCPYFFAPLSRQITGIAFIFGMNALAGLYYIYIYLSLFHTHTLPLLPLLSLLFISFFLFHTRTHTLSLSRSFFFTLFPSFPVSFSPSFPLSCSPSSHTHAHTQLSLSFLFNELLFSPFDKNLVICFTGTNNYYPDNGDLKNVSGNITTFVTGYEDMTNGCWVAVGGGALASFLLLFFRTEYRRMMVGQNSFTLFSLAFEGYLSCFLSLGDWLSHQLPSSSPSPSPPHTLTPIL